MTDSISESSESSTSSAEGSIVGVVAVAVAAPDSAIVDGMLSSEMAPNAGEDNARDGFGVIALNLDFRRTNVGDSFYFEELKENFIKLFLDDPISR